MKIALVGFAGSGKSTVFGALTGLAVETGYAASRDKINVGVVKVPDPRVDALAELYKPKKVTYAEVTFTDFGGGGGKGLDRAVLNAMREVDALCQVVRAFPDATGEPPQPLREIADLETETILADLELVERRVERLAKDRSNPRELDLLRRIQTHLEGERPLRFFELSEEENKMIAGYALLTQKPLLLVVNVDEGSIGSETDPDIEVSARERRLGVVVLSAQVEKDIASMSQGDQIEFVASLGLDEPASHRFIRAAYELIDLVSMLTVGPDECRAWPVASGSRAVRAAGKIHSDIERGFIRAEVIDWKDLIEHGSEAKCREAGLARVEGKDYIVQDGDVIHFRFNV
jgi:GTP-binding protein YchF